ncbi:MAG: DEAD/DEAH box helicase [Candidatus Omnitrophota bacterium]
MNKNIKLETATELPSDLEFSDEFRKAFDVLENSRENVFVTGNAGTGKSTLLEYFRVNTRKNIIVLAPTGVAAIKARGQTIHSFFRLPPRLIMEEHIKQLHIGNLIHRIDVVVVDEASMVRADMMDAMDHSLRLNRNEYNVPFGGVRVILFGDLFQLPPVVNKDIKNMMRRRYKTPYFFSANVFKEIGLKTINLNKIYRQKDKKFIDLLNKIREKKCNTEDLNSLNERVEKNIKGDAEGIITLATTNRGANKINEKHLTEIPHEEYRYCAEIKEEFEEKAYPTEGCITLKKNAQIILLRNDPKKRWVNGTICEIIELTDEFIRADIDGRICDIPKMTWEKIKYRYNKEKDSIEEEVVGSFTQYPVKLAWAITIHKSQGQTFDNVIIDIGEGAFTHGQTYVALSRCTTLEGIRLKKPITHDDIIFDDDIYDFMNEVNNANDVRLVDLDEGQGMRDEG